MSKHNETESVLEALGKFKDLSDFIPENQDFKHSKHLQYDKIEELLLLLKSDWINRVIGYFINHRTDSEYAELDNEYKVQDLIYLAAITIIPDLHFENPQSKNMGAITYTRIDFSSEQEELFIEIKHASSKHNAKKVEAEISEDIVKYGKRGELSNLIFFIYCHNYHFPSPEKFEESYTGSQQINGNKIDTHCIIKP